MFACIGCIWMVTAGDVMIFNFFFCFWSFGQYPQRVFNRPEEKKIKLEEGIRIQST